jgi:hypothetical protein
MHSATCRRLPTRHLSRRQEQLLVALPAVRAPRRTLVRSLRGKIGQAAVAETVTVTVRQTALAQRATHLQVVVLHHPDLAVVAPRQLELQAAAPLLVRR